MHQGHSSQVVRGGDYARYVELTPLDPRHEEWQGGIVPIEPACSVWLDGYLALGNLMKLGSLV